MIFVKIQGSNFNDDGSENYRVVKINFFGLSN